MVSTKDLRELFEDVRDDVSKRAAEAVKDTKLPKVSVGRDEPPVMLWFGIGVVLGAAIGVILGAVMTPYRGDETRRKIGEQVQKVRTRTEETNGQQRYETTTPSQVV